VSQADLIVDGRAGGLLAGSPFAIPSKKLAMWLFIISDTMTFAACLVAYGFLRNATPNWPRPFAGIANVAWMTFVLLTSSMTMLLGVRAGKAGDRAGAFRWTLVTAAAGVLFALLHVREWLELVDKGMRMFQNPWGSGLFGASFFSITGLHLLHVTAGIVALVTVAVRYQGGRYRGEDLEILGLYWHFVDLVWMFVVPLVYLLNLAH
jgi:cytochrome c oxidase subunit III